MHVPEYQIEVNNPLKLYNKLIFLRKALSTLTRTVKQGEHRSSFQLFALASSIGRYDDEGRTAGRGQDDKNHGLDCARQVQEELVRL